MQDKLEPAVAHISALIEEPPEIGLILGSGLGMLTERINEATAVSYADIPHFPLSTVEGHAGELVIGKLAGKPVLAMNGRFHMYEGYRGEQVAFPIRVMRKLGVRTLVVTNAAGAVNPDNVPGDLMLIRDHIHFSGGNPLIGPNAEQFGPRFPDMSEAYSARLRNLARETANELNIPLKEGVYAFVLGPSYETPAEVRMLGILGADAVGMSTVPEVIVARHAGMEVLGISCLTNMAAGISRTPLSHAEVMETAARVRQSFLRLTEAIVAKL